MARGPRSKYQKAFATKAKKMMANGAIHTEVAKALGIGLTTLYHYQNTQPEFAEALKAGGKLADDRVEAALHQTAVGYHIDTEKVAYDSRSGIWVRTDTTTYIQPSMPAQAFWLKNRRKEEWRDKQEHEVGGLDGGPIEIVRRIVKPDA